MAQGDEGAGESLERLKKFGERGTPYLRYELRERQFATLLRLSQEMIGKASVACAAPVFHTGDEFFERRMIRGIVDSTNFVSLGELAKGLLELGIHDHAHPGDHQWTYGLQPALGMLHSEGRAVESMLGREELLPWLRAKMIRAKEPLDVHFRSIAKAVRNWSTFLEVGSDKDGQELERGDEGRPSHPPESYAPWDPNEPRAPAIEALRTVERAGLGWHVALMPASALV